MATWLIRRLLRAVLTVLVAWAILIALVRVLPGDPLSAMLRDTMPPAAEVARLRAEWGFDQPLATALARRLTDLLHGDLGFSHTRQLPVATAIRTHLGPTLLLGTLTLLFDFLIGMALGVWSALHPRTRRARLISAAAIAGYAMPSFAIGMALIWIFAVHFGWLHPGGYADPLMALDAGRGTVLLDRLNHLVLPLATMVLATIAVPLRQQRAAALATHAAPWVLAAEARGIAPWRIAWKHCWRPALTPMVTLFGLWLPVLVSGAIFVERLFGWPGMGTLLADATMERDIPLVIGGGLVVIMMIQVGSLVADLLYRVVDPAQQAP